MPRAHRLSPREQAIADEVARQLRQDKPSTIPPADRVPLTRESVLKMPRAEIIERKEEIDAWMANGYRVPGESS